MAQAPRGNQSRNNQSGGTAVAKREEPTSAQLQKVSVLHRMAARLQMDPTRLQETLLGTVMQGCSREEFAMLLVVADELKLNPMRREIFAFPKKGGGIMPVVSIDGWITITNSQPELEGFEFEDLTDDDGNIYAVKCTMHRSDRRFPIIIIEYLDECKRNTDPWRDMPTRMLRHKAFIQCARYAFGFSGIYDEDEVGLDGRDLSAAPLPTLPPARTDEEGFADPATRPNAEEKVDETTGEVTEGEEDGEHPAAGKAREAMEAAGKAATIVDLNNVKTRFHEDVAAMPDDMRADVEAEYAAAEKRLKGK